MAGGTVPTVSDPNPQPISHSFTFDGSIGFSASVVISVRQRWGDAWTDKPELVCTNLNWTAAPTVPTATIVYRYGVALEMDGTEHIRPKLSLAGWYVRIVVTCADGVRKWHGFVDDIGDEPNGFISPTIGFAAAGQQTFSCVGMVAALDRSPMMNSFFTCSSGNQTPGYIEMRVALSAPMFNPRTKLTDEPGERIQIKNRAGFTQFVPSDKFDPDPMPSYPPTPPDRSRETHLLYWKNLYGYSFDGEYWNSKSIAEYLVAYHAPRDETNKERIPVWIHNPDAALPDWDQPEIDCEGLTLKGALDRLLNIKHSLGYMTWVDDGTNRLMIQPFTALEAALTVDTGKTIAANARWLDVNAVSDPATNMTVQQNLSAMANQVVVRGAKRIAITTLKVLSSGSTVTSALTNGWTSAEATAYFAEFPTALTGFTSQRVKYNAQDALEQGKYRNLFRNFILGGSWNFKVDWSPAATLVDLFTNDAFDVTYSYENDLSRYLPYPGNMKILPHLPLKEGIDYADPLLDEEAIIAAHFASIRPFREIEVYGKAHGPNYNPTAGPTGAPTIWTSRAKRGVMYDSYDPDYSIDADALPADKGHGVKLNMNGVSQLALNGGVSTDPHLPSLNSNSLYVTLAIEDDRHCENHWPLTVHGLDAINRKVFDFGDRYQMIYIAKGTILGTSEDSFEFIGNKTYVRDDRLAMGQLAKQLHRWYSTPRNVGRISTRRTTARIWPGQLIKTLNPSTTHAATCNCVITEVSMNFPIGTPDSPGKQSMSIITSRGEVDPMFFQPKLS